MRAAQRTIFQRADQIGCAGLDQPDDFAEGGFVALGGGRFGNLFAQGGLHGFKRAGCTRGVREIERDVSFTKLFEFSASSLMSDGTYMKMSLSNPYKGVPK